MKRFFTTVLLLSMLSVTATLSNGLNLNSIGVKAGGMGGAFIGLEMIIPQFIGIRRACRR